MELQKMQNLLGTLKYPLTKEQLLQEITNHGLLESLPLVNSLPDQPFTNANDILSKLKDTMGEMH